MKIFAYEHFLNNITDLTIDLIPMGLECIQSSSKEEFVNILKKDQNIPILLTGTEDTGLLKIVREINQSIYIFYIVKNTMKPEMMKTLTPFNISAIINFSESSSHIAEEIVRNIVANNISKKDQRVHIRVRPKDQEIIQSAVCIKDTGRFIRGKVIDISAGGCAIKFDNPSEVSLLTPRTVYDPLLLKIDETGIKAVATLIAMRNNTAGFHFDNVEHSDMRKLSAYIYRQIMGNYDVLEKTLTQENAV
jgi:hypothetical protein